MTAKRRSLSLAALPALMAALIPTIAAGAPAGAMAPRLTGSFRTKLTITYANNLGKARVGDAASRTWTFTPACATGACTTVLRRPSIYSKSVYVYTLDVKSASQYRGSTKPAFAPCEIHGSTQVIRRGYSETQTIVLQVTRSSAGAAVAYTGTEDSLYTPTSAGLASGCTLAEQRARFSS